MTKRNQNQKHVEIHHEYIDPERWEKNLIKDFWAQLKDSDRRKLLVIEKDTLLKKMKEQQKYICQCTMCGRHKYIIKLLILLTT